ncbi:ABC transporter ATP-binding protein [Patescibacteria group bacterium AH-259-L05]|nr:ABC transporter ATP-binding protein [Patescibacteria group bacterium AH-259-L05]
MLQLNNVWKTYLLGEVKLDVLKGINLEIYSGDFMTIMGPSGSGKSTLMYIIGSLDVPTKGTVFLQQKNVTDFSEDELAQIRSRKIGFVFQQFNLLPNLTALENVMLPMVFAQIPEEERKKRAQEILISLDLDKRAHHRPGELSGGEQQRVAIARSLANDPDIILADEPTGNLDSATGKTIMNILTGLHKDKKKTIIVVTHDSMIAQYSKNLVNIKDGEIVHNHLQAEKALWDK